MPDLIFAAPALAYIGPGGALSFIGSAIALIAAVVLAFFGFIWYPLKRGLRWRRRSSEATNELNLEQTGETSTSRDATGS